MFVQSQVTPNVFVPYRQALVDSCPIINGSSDSSEFTDSEISHLNTPTPSGRNSTAADSCDSISIGGSPEHDVVDDDMSDYENGDVMYAPTDMYETVTDALHKITAMVGAVHNSDMLKVLEAILKAVEESNDLVRSLEKTMEERDTRLDSHIQDFKKMNANMISASNKRDDNVDDALKCVISRMSTSSDIGQLREAIERSITTTTPRQVNVAVVSTTSSAASSGANTLTSTDLMTMPLHSLLTAANNAALQSQSHRSEASTEQGGTQAAPVDSQVGRQTQACRKFPDGTGHLLPASNDIAIVSPPPPPHTSGDEPKTKRKRARPISKTHDELGTVQLKRKQQQQPQRPHRSDQQHEQTWWYQQQQPRQLQQTTNNHQHKPPTQVLPPTPPEPNREQALRRALECKASVSQHDGSVSINHDDQNLKHKLTTTNVVPLNNINDAKDDDLTTALTDLNLPIMNKNMLPRSRLHQPWTPHVTAPSTPADRDMAVVLNKTADDATTNTGSFNATGEFKIATYESLPSPLKYHLQDYQLPRYKPKSSERLRCNLQLAYFHHMLSMCDASGMTKPAIAKSIFAMGCRDGMWTSTQGGHKSGEICEMNMERYLTKKVINIFKRAARKLRQAANQQVEQSS